MRGDEGRTKPRLHPLGHGEDGDGSVDGEGRELVEMARRGQGKKLLAVCAEGLANVLKNAKVWD